MPYVTVPGNASGDIAVSVNGYPLNLLAYNVKSYSGLFSSSGLRGANSVSPGRDGEIWTRGKKREALKVVLQMWISPISEAGVAPTSRAQAFANWQSNRDRLMALFDSSQALLDLRQTINGVTRQAYAESPSSSDFDVASSPSAQAEFSVELTVPAAFWQDVNALQTSSLVGTNSIGNTVLTHLAGATAPCDDQVYAVSGPITNPKVADTASGHYVQFAGTVSDGATWTVDAGAWTSLVGTTNVTAQTTASGPFLPRLMVISPRVDRAAPSVTLTGASVGANTKLVVSGRRKYR